MRQLNIYSLGGVHHELYNPDIDSLYVSELKYEGMNSLRNANALFWAKHLCEESVRELIDILKDRKNSFSKIHIKYEAVVADPENFVQRVSNARKYLCDQGISQLEFFGHLETLAILCSMYSDFVYKSFVLTLHEGFLMNNLSSLTIVNNCLIPAENPYLNFIKEHCLPVILEAKPEIIWLNGRITHASIAIARLARQAFPDVHISVVEHSSEYYSLNKISKFLLKNNPLFSIIDSIVLDNSESTRNELVSSLKNKIPLDNINNIIFCKREDSNIEIKQIKYKQYQAVEILEHTMLRPKSSMAVDIKVDPSKIANVKMWPDHICYWNKCTFCGINNKYHTISDKIDVCNWSVTKQIQCVEQLVSSGIDYIWLIDEAIPPETLLEFAKGIIKSNLDVKWQARSRLESAYTDLALCKTLADAGLKEIRLGLESGSPRVLKLMNKFENDFDPKRIEVVVKNFHEAGISVHFPMMIGFPTETIQDRNITYELLWNLKTQYPSFTFNINILGLDITSKLYSNFEEYGITTLEFPCEARHFMGNLVDWDSSIVHFDKSTLEIERDQVMRQLLYPWMPKTALIQPHIFYRLSETIRNTLTSKVLYKDQQAIGFLPEATISLSDYTKNFSVLSQEGAQKEYFYNWQTHNYLMCDNEYATLMHVLAQPAKISEILQQFKGDSLQINKFIKQAIELGFLEIRCLQGSS